MPKLGTFTHLSENEKHLRDQRLRMAFVRTKTINGREYRYLVENVREGDKVRQKVIRYLGKA